MIRTLTLALFTALSAAALACPGGAIKLNDSSVIRGDGLISNHQQMSPEEAIRKFPGDNGFGMMAVMSAKSGKIAVTDSSGKITHYVEIWNVEGDSKLGHYQHIATTYEIYDAKKHSLGQWRVATNYHGNGVLTRALPNPAAAPQIERKPRVSSVGCNQVDIANL